MQDQPGAGEEGKPAPLFTIHEVKVGDQIKKGARGTVGNTTVSIQPNQNGFDDVEVAFLRKGRGGKDKFVGDPLRVDAKQEDLEEFADMVTRHLKGGQAQKICSRYSEQTKNGKLRRC